jgi:glycosyltransferase involved in cell wall biosynthesis
MNVLFLTYQGDIAGSTNSIAYLAKALAEKGHQVYLGCRKESLIYTMMANSKVITIPMVFRGKLDIFNASRIANITKSYKIDIINAQSSYDRYTAGLAKILFGCKAKLVHTRRQMPLSDGFFFQTWFYNKTADSVVAVSSAVKIGLENVGVNAGKITVILNGTPQSKYNLPDIDEKVSALKSKYDLSSTDNVIGCISRRKKQEQLLQSLELVEIPCTIILVGIKSDRELNRIISKPEYKHRVIFTGELNINEALYYHKLMRIEVLPSTMEGLSQSLLEGMAFGIPVIATAFAGNLDLINDGENGLLFENNDIIDLAKKITLLLTDPSIAKKLSLAGKITALEKFEIGTVVKNYEALFKKLTKASYNN